MRKMGQQLTKPAAYPQEFGFQWHITNFCNLRCRHCYQEDFSKRSDLDFGANEQIIRKISNGLRTSKIHINLTGGEPLLRNDIFEVIGLFEDLKNIVSVSIITNGLLLNEKVITRLSGFEKLKELKISLEAGSPAKNDSIRGKGSFRRVIANIEQAVKRSFKKIIIIFTLGSYNYTEIGEMLRLGQDLGVDGVIIERFVPLGRGKSLKPGFLKEKEWREVVNRLIDFSGIAIRPAELLRYRAFWLGLKNDQEFKGALCNLGSESMALMPNADVYPCRRFETKIGNLQEEEFDTILLRLKLLRETIEKNIKGRCKDCLVRGCFGCRALVYALTRDFLAEDPQCFRWSV